MFLGRLYSRFLFAIGVFGVRFKLVPFFTIIFPSPAKCGRHGFSIITFVFSLKPSSSSSVWFHFVFFFNNCLTWSVFSENLGKTFAMYCIAPKNDPNFLLDAGGFNCGMAVNLPLFGFIPFSLISCPNHVVSSRKYSDSLACSLFGFLKFLKYCKWICTVFFFVPPFLLLMCQLATEVLGSSIFCLLFLEIFSK